MPVKQINGTSGTEGGIFLAASVKTLKFSGTEGFQGELRRRVEQYFRTTGQRQRDCPWMYLKTAVVIGWLAASYGLLVFAVGTWWQALPLALALGLAMAALGFNVQHDG